MEFTLSWVALGSFHGYNQKLTSQLWTYLLIHGYGYEELEHPPGKVR